MSILTLTTHRIAALVMLIGCLIVLADGTARMELARAVSATLHDDAYMVMHISAADE